TTPVSVSTRTNSHRGGTANVDTEVNFTRVLPEGGGWWVVPAGGPGRCLRSGVRVEIWSCTARSRREHQISPGGAGGSGAGGSGAGGSGADGSGAGGGYGAARAVRQAVTRVAARSATADAGSPGRYNDVPIPAPAAPARAQPARLSASTPPTGTRPVPAGSTLAHARIPSTPTA